MDKNFETFVIYVVSLNSTPLNVHLSHRLQISGLIAEEVPTKIFAEYLDFTDIFSLNLAFKLCKHTRINDHAIKLVDSQQIPYKPIYSLKLVELETPKAYIEINLANGFIRLSKFPANALILFDRKSASSFQLCVNY